MHPNEVWESQEVRARAARFALTPLSWLYAAGWQGYRAIYDLGIKKAKEPHPRVVCVGNLTVGGSGKSPVTLAIAHLLLNQRVELVIGCSGYGSPASENATLAPEGELDAARWGDEPAMLRWLLPDVPMVIGRARVAAAQLVVEKYPNSVLLMDDGFQHLPLRKKVTILLDDPSPFNGRALPAGPYREPRLNRGRADIVLSTRPDQGPFWVRRVPLGLTTPDGAPATATEIQVLCALAKPEGFISSLESQGFTIQAKKLLPDHDPLTSGTLFDGLNPNLPLVVTAKDWVKLRHRTDAGAYKILVAREVAHIEPEAAFLDALNTKLGRG